MELQSMKHLKLKENFQLPSGDALETMLRLQKEVNKRIYPIVLMNIGMGEERDIPNSAERFSFQDKEALLKEYLLATIRECAEALDLINSKPWKKTKKDVDLEEFKFEIIDIQHFVNSIYDILQMNRNDVLRYYIAKNEENNRRVNDGY